MLVVTDVAHTLIHMRRLVVWTLLALCETQDRLHLDHLTHSHALATHSAALDERWGTGVWHTVNEADRAR
jgi:hypothetical protein